MDTDMDVLMLEALDGTIAPSDRARLDAHLAAHPEARAMFERTLRMDLALRKTPLPPMPLDFSQRVLDAARVTRIRQPITRRHLAAFIVTNSVLMILAWLISGAVFLGLVVLVLQQPIVQPTVVLVHSAAVYAAALMGLFSSLVRAVTSQPAFWVGMMAMGALVAAWFGLLFRVLRPAREYAR